LKKPNPNPHPTPTLTLIRAGTLAPTLTLTLTLTLDEDFAILHALEKVYQVDAKELPNVIENSELNRMDQNELQSFINKRSDFEKSWVGKYF